VPLLVPLERERAIYLAIELDRSWTENFGVNPQGGIVYFDKASALVAAFLHLLAGEGLWKKTAFESPAAL
jgi:hypothetical protein